MIKLERQIRKILVTKSGVGFVERSFAEGLQGELANNLFIRQVLASESLGEQITTLYLSGCSAPVLHHPRRPSIHRCWRVRRNRVRV